MKKSDWKALVQVWQEAYCRRGDELVALEDALRPFAEANIVASRVGDEDRTDWCLVASSTRTALCSTLLDNNAELLTVAHLRAARKALRG